MVARVQAVAGQDGGELAHVEGEGGGHGPLIALRFGVRRLDAALDVLDRSGCSFVLTRRTIQSGVEPPHSKSLTCTEPSRVAARRTSAAGGPPASNLCPSA